MCHCSNYFKISFNDDDASLSIMFNFGVCPQFSNVSYKISYASNMSASLLVLVGSTKIAFVFICIQYQKLLHPPITDDWVASS